MIHQITFTATHEHRRPRDGKSAPVYNNYTGLYEYPGLKPEDYTNDWDAIKKCLENTGDFLIWIVTTEQLHTFVRMLNKYDLKKYCVVDHSGPMDGTQNRNYPGNKRRLKVFIMKGEK